MTATSAFFAIAQTLSTLPYTEEVGKAVFPLILLAAGVAPAQVAISPDPEHESVELENPWIRVFRVHLAPHAKTVMRAHPDRVVIPLGEQRMSVSSASGKPVERKCRAGDIYWEQAGARAIENRGDSRLETLLVELKKALSARPPDSLDAVRTDPRHFQTVIDNSEVRVTRVHYGAKEASQLVSHPSRLMVLLTAAQVRVIPRNGKPDNRDGRPGQIEWLVEETSKTENRSNEPLDAILVEPK